MIYSFKFVAVLLLGLCYGGVTKKQVRQFPKGFKFGAASSSYQVEGSWDEDGKTANVWDYLTHSDLSPVRNKSTGDISADSYHQYKRDVEMMRELGLDFYRFSMSWNRILPTSFPDKINKAGVKFYNNLINEMLKYNIEPVVTLFHWDLPQILQELGGWTNPNIIDWFADYAHILFKTFGDRVKTWISINEPHFVCKAYGRNGFNVFPNTLNTTGITEYLCIKNLLLAHAKVYNLYKKEFKSTQSGQVGIASGSLWHEASSEENVKAVEIANQFHLGLTVHPIFSEKGDYPEVVKQTIAAKSAEQGFLRSRLPELTPEEINFIRGSSDFFGLNYYASDYAYATEPRTGLYPVPSYQDDVGVSYYKLPEWRLGESDMIMNTPWGFYDILKKIKDDYNNPPVYILENGFATIGGLVDDDRITYIRGYLDSLLDAVDDGCDVRVYTLWGLMDCFDWMRGYTQKFGLYEVNFEDPGRARTPRKSAFVYKEIVRTRALDWGYEPDLDNTTITINN